MEIGRILIIFGLFLAALGLLFTFAPGLRLGRLPGDIHLQRENWSVYIPITTCILLSMVLSMALWIVSLLRR